MIMTVNTTIKRKYLQMKRKTCVVMYLTYCISRDTDRRKISDGDLNNNSKHVAQFPLTSVVLIEDIPVSFVVLTFTK
jgi:hypothetical protein